jgi:hypothetical protein
MSFKKYLMEDEEVLSYCGTDYWIWVCTDRRVMKYRQGSGTAEQLHDISYEEITSISLVNTGRDDKLGGYAVFSLVLGGIASVWVSSAAPFAVAGVITAYLLWRWRNSEHSYFEFKGSGVINSDEEEWRIDNKNADNPDEIREFTKTVRSQL